MLISSVNVAAPRPRLSSFGLPSFSPTDAVTLSAPNGGATAAASKKKAYRALAWTGFGLNMVGGGLTLAGHGAVGLSIFAVGSAAMVVGEAMARRK